MIRKYWLLAVLPLGFILGWLVGGSQASDDRDVRHAVLRRIQFHEYRGHLWLLYGCGGRALAGIDWRQPNVMHVHRWPSAADANLGVWSGYVHYLSDRWRSNSMLYAGNERMHEVGREEEIRSFEQEEDHATSPAAKLAALIVGGSGMYFGYRFGMRDAPSCLAPEMRRELDDAYVWRRAAVGVALRLEDDLKPNDDGIEYPNFLRDLDPSRSVAITGDYGNVEWFHPDRFPDEGAMRGLLARLEAARTKRESIPERIEQYIALIGLAVIVGAAILRILRGTLIFLLRALISFGERHWGWVDPAPERSDGAT